jgi:hypothetical protein
MTTQADALHALRQEIEKSLLEKAAADAAFRSQLKENPHAALKVLLGVDPIPSFKINIVEEQSGEVTIVLPRDIAQDELPDTLLDLVAGGADATPCDQVGKGIEQAWFGYCRWCNQIFNVK